MFHFEMTKDVRFLAYERNDYKIKKIDYVVNLKNQNEEISLFLVAILVLKDVRFKLGVFPLFVPKRILQLFLCCHQQCLYKRILAIEYFKVGQRELNL